jgi:hypothetical protein
MQAEAGGAFSHFSRGRSEISSLSLALLRPLDHHAFLLVALGLFGKPVIHVSYAGRTGGSGFSRFLRGRSEISSLSPALSRQPVAP